MAGNSVTSPITSHGQHTLLSPVAAADSEDGAAAHMT